MIILDCEIVRAIPSAKSDPLPGIEYCDGWHDFAGMGISVTVAYDFFADQYRVFCADNLRELQRLIDRSSHIIGFHSCKFDGPLLAAHGVHIPHAKHYDLRRETLIVAGHDPDAPHDRNRGYSLDSMCAANGITIKEMSGAHAPIMWQRGQRGAVIDYCVGDVMRTNRLFTRACASMTGAGHIIDPVTLKPLQLRAIC